MAKPVERWQAEGPGTIHATQEEAVAAEIVHLLGGTKQGADSILPGIASKIVEQREEFIRKLRELPLVPDTAPPGQAGV